MSEQSSLDLGSVLGTLVLVVVMLAVVVNLMPALAELAWKLLPGLLVVWVIVIVIRGMISKLLE